MPQAANCPQSSIIYFVLARAVEDVSPYRRTVGESADSRGRLSLRGVVHAGRAVEDACPYNGRLANPRTVRRLRHDACPYMPGGGLFAACGMTSAPTDGGLTLSLSIAKECNLCRLRVRNRLQIPLAPPRSFATLKDDRRGIRAFAPFRILLSRRILHFAKVRLRATKYRNFFALFAKSRVVAKKFL